MPFNNFIMIHKCNIDITPRSCGRRHTWRTLTVIRVFKFDLVSFFSENKISKWSLFSSFFCISMSWSIFDAQGEPDHLRRWLGYLILPKSRKRVCSLDNTKSCKRLFWYNHLINRIVYSLSLYLLAPRKKSVLVVFNLTSIQIISQNHILLSNTWEWIRKEYKIA